MDRIKKNIRNILNYFNRLKIIEQMKLRYNSSLSNENSLLKYLILMP